MSDLKTERLLNLTIALLATQRLLTKNEIFTSVAGYSGSQESMERMFERDKDDLRSLGIEIEVAPIDSFFEDELGYRIKPESYSLSMPELTPAELGIMSVAAMSWQNVLFSQSAQSGLRKIESLGIEVDRSMLDWSPFVVDSHHPDFSTLWEAINSCRPLSFIYETSESAERLIHPYRLHIEGGEWYLLGIDTADDVMKTFKLRRMSSVSMSGKAQSFSRDNNRLKKMETLADSIDNDITARILIRKGKALSLRNRCNALENYQEDSDWDLGTFPAKYEGEIVSLALWHGPDVQLLEPIHLREKVISLLKERVDG